MNPSKLSPLWIISIFVTFTETVLGYAVTKTDSWIQGALAIFVMLFAIGIASAFFYILWHKPFHFYSPADFGNMSPKDFVDAIQGSPVVQQAAKVANNPTDTTAIYQLLDSILDNTFKQHLIFMAEKNVQFPYVPWGQTYQHGTRGKGWASGGFQGDEFLQKLNGTGFIELIPSAPPKLQITEKGKSFVEWLVKNGRKAEFYTSPLGGWGVPFSPKDDGLPAQQPQAVGQPAATVAPVKPAGQTPPTVKSI